MSKLTKRQTDIDSSQDSKRNKLVKLVGMIIAGSAAARELLVEIFPKLDTELLRNGSRTVLLATAVVGGILLYRWLRRKQRDLQRTHRNWCDGEAFCERNESAANHIEDWLFKSDEPCFLLHGETGSGKTYFLNQFLGKDSVDTTADRTPAKSGALVYSLYRQESNRVSEWKALIIREYPSRFEEFLIQMLSEVGGKAGEKLHEAGLKLHEALEQVDKKFKSERRGLLLIFDELHNAPLDSATKKCFNAMTSYIRNKYPSEGAIDSNLKFLLSYDKESAFGHGIGMTQLSKTFVVHPRIYKMDALAEDDVETILAARIGFFLNVLFSDIPDAFIDMLEGQENTSTWARHWIKREKRRLEEKGRARDEVYFTPAFVNGILEASSLSSLVRFSLFRSPSLRLLFYGNIASSIKDVIRSSGRSVTGSECRAMLKKVVVSMKKRSLQGRGVSDIFSADDEQLQKILERFVKLGIVRDSDKRVTHPLFGYWLSISNPDNEDIDVVFGTWSRGQQIVTFIFLIIALLVTGSHLFSHKSISSSSVKPMPYRAYSVYQNAATHLERSVESLDQGRRELEKHASLLKKATSHNSERDSKLSSLGVNLGTARKMIHDTRSEVLSLDEKDLSFEPINGLNNLSRQTETRVP